MHHLVIVDGHHLLYRAYWAIPRSLRTAAGEQVNTAFGVASMLLQILKVEEPTHLLFCFDADEDTFRHQEYKEYKSGRQETPEDFYPQIPRALAVIDSFGIKNVSGNRFEADDFAGAYALAATGAGMRVTIVSGDRDLLQLASDKIRIAIPHKGYQAAEYIGPEQVLAKFGVTAAQIPAYKGLVGDASDNLPGVHGIGPVAASALLQQFGTLQSMYEHLDQVKSSWRTKLEAGKEQAFFCERMATLVTAMQLPVPLEDLLLHDLDPDVVRAVFKALDFVLLTRRFDAMLATPFGRRVFRPSATAASQEPVPSRMVGAPSESSSLRSRSDQMQLL